MKKDNIPEAAVSLLNLVYKQVEQVTQDDNDRSAFFIHCKDGTTVKLKVEVLNRGGAEIVH